MRWGERTDTRSATKTTVSKRVRDFADSPGVVFGDAVLQNTESE